MTQSRHRPSTWSLRRVAGDERGQVFIMFALSSVVLIGMCGFAIDFARILYARTVLQASSDAAAAAGAQQLPNEASAISFAIQYSSLAAQKNFRTNMTGVSMAASYPDAVCLTSSGLPVCPVAAGNPWSVANNALRVRQQVTVPMYFAGILGVPPMVVTATSTAGMKGGGPPPMDIVIVLDATWSMSFECGASTKINCAKEGIRALLTSLWPCTPGSTCSGATPVYDQVGLIVFPPPVNITARGRELDCINNIGIDDLHYDNSANPTSNPNYNYTIAAISNDFKTSATALALNASSDLVKAMGLGNCGLETPPTPASMTSPEGKRLSTTFATAIEKAQAMLDAANLVTGRNKAQDVIIVVGDGGANYGPAYYLDTTNYRKRPCRQAIDSANNIATSKGTWIYSVAYESIGNCIGWVPSDPARGINRFTVDENPAIAAIYTMQEIASDPTKFYSQPDPAELTTVFKRIAADLTTTRLVSDDTP